MNANISNNARLNRIKIICRTLKVMLWLYLACMVVFMPGFLRFAATLQEGHWTWTVFGRTYASFTEVPWLDKSVALVCVAMMLAAIFTGYRLLGLYERGVIFAAENVRLLRRIGALALSYGLLAVLGGNLIEGARILVGTSGISARLLLFDSVGILISPWVIGGVCLLALSYIMDEGRKIQEEQELTV
jgi:hypothetical protein